MQAKIRTFLWLPSRALEAARFYTSLFADGEIEGDYQFPSEDNSVSTIELKMGGSEYVLMSAPGAPVPNEVFSFSVICSDQAEVDRLWDALLEGGEPLMCGWLKDRFGLCWQITPARMAELMEAGSPAQREAVMKAMMGMIKMDIAGLEAAFDGAA